MDLIYSSLTYLFLSFPFALMLGVPLAFFLCMHICARRGVFSREGISLTDLHRVRTVAMNKTSTLTEGNFTLNKIVTVRPDQYSETEILSLAAACESISSHPIARCICSYAKHITLPAISGGNLTEIAGEGILLEYEKGLVFCGNRRMMEAEEIDLSGFTASPYETEVLVCKNDRLIGYILLSDTLKEQAPLSVEMLKKANIQPVLLTGDDQESAAAIARRTGISDVYAELLPESMDTKIADLQPDDGNLLILGSLGRKLRSAMPGLIHTETDLESVAIALLIVNLTYWIALENMGFALIGKALALLCLLLGKNNIGIPLFIDAIAIFCCACNSIRLLLLDNCPHPEQAEHSAFV